MVTLSFNELLALVILVASLAALPGAAIGQLFLYALQERLGVSASVVERIRRADAGLDADGGAGGAGAPADADQPGGRPIAPDETAGGQPPSRPR